MKAENFRKGLDGLIFVVFCCCIICSITGPFSEFGASVEGFGMAILSCLFSFILLYIEQILLWVIFGFLNIDFKFNHSIKEFLHNK